MSHPSRGAGAPSQAESKGERTRRKLVDAAGALMRRQGFHATGLSDIVAESGAPRGSLYFHFPGGKDELACEAIDMAGAAWRARIEAATARAPDPGAAIEAVVELLAEDLEASGFQNGCPAAAVALETMSPRVRKTVLAHYTRWEIGIAERLAASGIAEPIARQLATVALSAIEGALLLARVQKSRAPLVTVGQALRSMVASMRPA
jgi:TetR/AcrR family transcriptional regulator, lmrAB and yxaGH operons repressor